MNAPPQPYSATGYDPAAAQAAAAVEGYGYPYTPPGYDPNAYGYPPQPQQGIAASYTPAPAYGGYGYQAAGPSAGVGNPYDTASYGVGGSLPPVPLSNPSQARSAPASQTPTAPRRKYLVQQQIRQQQVKQQQQRKPRQGQRTAPLLAVNVQKVTVRTRPSSTTVGTGSQVQAAQTQKTAPTKPKAQQTRTQTQRLQTLQQQSTRGRPIELQNVKLSRWTYSTSSDPHLYLDGEKILIVPEKALPKNRTGRLQYRIPQNYSDKALVVRENRAGKEVLALYYLNIYDPQGKRVFLKTDIILPQ